MRRRAEEIELPFVAAKTLPTLPLETGFQEPMSLEEVRRFVDVCGPCGGRQLKGKFVGCLFCGAPNGNKKSP